VFGVPPDSAATKARLLEAAFDEFAQYGLAGARVDRIAESAGANKRLIYVYYGNKDGLFEAVLAQRVGVITDAVPFTADDLPAYASALFDYLLAEPRLLRLVTWHQLERPSANLAEQDAYRSKLRALADAQKQGAITTTLEPVDLLALVLGQVTAWFAVSPGLRDLAADEAFTPKRLSHHRTALTNAVRMITCP
jgi:AcrR family transcriptional regulator